MTDSALKTALLSLSVENDNHWTKAGLPRLETLKFLTGDSSLTQEVVSAEIPGFNREAAGLPISNVVNMEKAKVIPEVVNKLTLSEQLVVEQLQLESVRKQFHEVELALKTQTALVSHLAEEVSIELGIETSQDAIISYLKGQQQDLQERAARQKIISESGINLKELAQNLRSPLDSSLARKR